MPRAPGCVPLLQSPLSHSNGCQTSRHAKSNISKSSSCSTVVFVSISHVRSKLSSTLGRPCIPRRAPMCQCRSSKRKSYFKSPPRCAVYIGSDQTHSMEYLNDRRKHLSQCMLDLQKPEASISQGSHFDNQPFRPHSRTVGK